MKIGNCKIEILNGDITKVATDAIVNAANPSLMGGGGVDGAIHRAGGEQILRECRQIISNKGRCAPGEAVITTAGKLPAKFVIHTVGPIWHGGHDKEEILLGNAYVNSIKLAEQHNLTSISFPNISTGVYGFPRDLAIKTVKKALEDALQDNSSLRQVNLVCFDQENYELYKKSFS